jgi:hypothetical protein
MELTEKCKERGLLYIPRKGDRESRIISSRHDAA